MRCALLLAMAWPFLYSVHAENGGSSVSVLGWNIGDVVSFLTASARSPTFYKLIFAMLLPVHVYLVYLVARGARPSSEKHVNEKQCCSHQKSTERKRLIQKYTAEAQHYAFQLNHCEAANSYRSLAQACNESEAREGYMRAIRLAGEQHVLASDQFSMAGDHVRAAKHAEIARQCYSAGHDSAMESETLLRAAKHYVWAGDYAAYNENHTFAANYYAMATKLYQAGGHVLEMKWIGAKAIEQYSRAANVAIARNMLDSVLWCQNGIKEMVELTKQETMLSVMQEGEEQDEGNR